MVSSPCHRTTGQLLVLFWLSPDHATCMCTRHTRQTLAVDAHRVCAVFYQRPAFNLNASSRTFRARQKRKSTRTTCFHFTTNTAASNAYRSRPGWPHATTLFRSKTSQLGLMSDLATLKAIRISCPRPKVKTKAESCTVRAIL